jgi:hypothetical protein
MKEGKTVHGNYSVTVGSGKHDRNKNMCVSFAPE